MALGSEGLRALWGLRWPLLGLFTVISLNVLVDSLTLPDLALFFLAFLDFFWRVSSLGDETYFRFEFN